MVRQVRHPWFVCVLAYGESKTKCGAARTVSG